MKTGLNAENEVTVIWLKIDVGGLKMNSEIVHDK